jgi:thioredoxin-related protein
MKRMKRYLISTAVLLSLFSAMALSQEKPQIYDPGLDGMKQIKEAIATANNEGKNVFIQLGGNWCPWCILFHNFVNDDPEVKEMFDKNFVTVKLNYSPENKNEEATSFLENPGRFGYPVFIILDGEGKRIHTQNSAYLEEGRGYNKKEVLDFLKAWSPGAY